MKKVILILLGVSNLFAQTGEDGLTFSQRKVAWLKSVPEPTNNLNDHEKRMYFSAWLEKGVYNDVVSATLKNLIGPFWLESGRSHHGYLAAFLVKFGSNGSGIIPRADEAAVHDKYEQDLINNSCAFGNINPNKQMWTMAGIYIYTTYFNKNLDFPVYGYRKNIDAEYLPLFEKNWPTFSFGGRDYLFGKGPYNARQLAEDFINYSLINWYLNGNREFDSLNYHRAFVSALLMIYDMSQDSELRRKAKMAAELAMLDAVMDFGESEWGGTLGRTDYQRTIKNSNFPFYIYFGKGKPDNERPDLKVLYTFNYEPPRLLLDLADLTDENNDYFHFHKENHKPNLKSEISHNKWNYVTPFYNIGSNASSSNSGWQVTIKGDVPGKFIRFWINDMVNISDTDESYYLGRAGRQFKNAVFANIGTQPILHERLKYQKWDEEIVESELLFKRLNNVFVAIRMGSKTASVEMAIRGVDYNSFSAFMTAVKKKSSLNVNSYRTSKGTTIYDDDYCGLNSPGDCTFPFKRMETVYDGGSIIKWVKDVMTVNYHGETLVYDFSDWPDDNPVLQDANPAPPANVNVKILE